MNPTSSRLFRAFTFLIWIGLIASFWIYSQRADLSAFDVVRQLIDFASSSVWGPIIYVLFYTVQPIVFFPSTFLTLAAGYLYGPFLGTGLAIVGSNASSALAWLIGRYFGESLVSDRFKQSMVNRFAERLQTNAFQSVLLMRLIYLPYDVVSYFSGFMRLAFASFVLATIFGGLPGTISFALFGASIEGDFLAETPTLNPWALAGAVGLFIISVSISRIIKHRDPEPLTEISPVAPLPAQISADGVD